MGQGQKKPPAAPCPCAYGPLRVCDLMPDPDSCVAPVPQKVQWLMAPIREVQLKVDSGSAIDIKVERLSIVTPILSE